MRGREEEWDQAKKKKKRVIFYDIVNMTILGENLCCGEMENSI